MNVVLAVGGLLCTFQQADTQEKVIVPILCFGSALTWSVMLTEWRQLRRARQTGESFLAQFSASVMLFEPVFLGLRSR